MPTSQPNASSISRELDEALDDLCMQLRVAWHDGDLDGIKLNVNAINSLMRRIEDVVKEQLWRSADGCIKYSAHES